MQSYEYFIMIFLKIAQSNSIISGPWHFGFCENISFSLFIIIFSDNIFFKTIVKSRANVLVLTLQLILIFFLVKSLPHFRLKFQSIQMDSTSKYTIKTSISSQPLDSLPCSSLSRLYSTNFISSIYPVNHLTGYRDTVLYIFPLLLKAPTKR